MRLFCARGSAAPVWTAARAYREHTSRQVEVAVCGKQCLEGCEPGQSHGFVHEVSAGSFDMAIAGSETDMDELDQLGRLVQGSRRSLGMREAALLVPQGNPASVRGLEDLARPGLRVGISTLDCLRGVWEDVCGRHGSIDAVRDNIVDRVQGCMAIIDAVASGRVDAAFGWTSFGHDDPRLEVVRLPPTLRVYRSTAAALLVDGPAHSGHAAEFLEYLCSDGRAHFLERGWR